MDANELLSRIRTFDDPSQWDLLPLLERLSAEGVPFRVHQRPHLTHGATEVVELSAKEEGAAILQQFFGLADPASPLPEAYVERAVNEARDGGSGPWRELLDILGERFVIEDWKAWRARFGGISDSSGMPRPASALVDASCGEALSAAIVSSGFIAHRVWSPSTVASAIELLTGARCNVAEFEPEWIALPDLGNEEPMLGNTVIGDRLLAKDGGAVFTLEAESWDSFSSFLANPGDSDLGHLFSMASDGKISCTAILRSRTSPQSSLLASERHPGSQLGVDSWLQSADGYPADYKCEVSLPQTSKWRGA